MKKSYYSTENSGAKNETTEVYRCDFCDNSFLRHQSYAIHLTRVHLDDEDDCGICDDDAASLAESGGRTLPLCRPCRDAIWSATLNDSQTRTLSLKLGFRPNDDDNYL